MKKARSSPLLLLAASIALVPLLRVQLVRAESERFCDQYARRAVRQYSEIKDNVSGISYTEAAWKGDYDYHYKWCRRVSEKAAIDSHEYRARKVNLSRVLDGYSEEDRRNISKALDGNSELLLPGMVIGLRHRQRRESAHIAGTGVDLTGNNEDMYDPTVLDNSKLTYLHGGDDEAPYDLGFNWNSVKDKWALARFW